MERRKPDLKGLAIITTHPIQYNAPWFRLLAQRKNIAIKVFYTWGQLEQHSKYDPGFGKNIAWDIPLLEGYQYCFVKNISTDPGSHHFTGIDNPTLIEDVEKWNPDAILIFGWNFKSHLKVLRYFKQKRKILFRGDSNLLDERPGYSLKKMLRRVFLKWIYTHIDIALYVGTANKDYYLKHGVKNSQLIFAPHAIDNDRFMQGQAGNHRKEFGISPDAFVFLFVGKFEAKKDPQVLMDSFLKLQHSNVHLIMVGNGNLETELKLSASRSPLEISKRIHFLPFQNQSIMPAIYKICDVLVLPSQGPGETWGLTVNEAMACSKAVLVSAKCGCAVDLVKDGVNGFVFKSKDGNDLVSKMNKIIQAHAYITDMGKQSLTIIDQWRFEKLCQAVEEFVN
jgi:glycosyltransferase involved in cell wall biosynthesis